MGFQFIFVRLNFNYHLKEWLFFDRLDLEDRRLIKFELQQMSLGFMVTPRNHLPENVTVFLLVMSPHLAMLMN
jgi:hypothetical protein